MRWQRRLAVDKISYEAAYRLFQLVWRSVDVGKGEGVEPPKEGENSFHITEQNRDRWRVTVTPTSANSAPSPQEIKAEGGLDKTESTEYQLQEYDPDRYWETVEADRSLYAMLNRRDALQMAWPQRTYRILKVTTIREEVTRG
jgi:hypothetical protein